jgi:hypothetical protein
MIAARIRRRLGRGRLLHSGHPRHVHNRPDKCTGRIARDLSGSRRHRTDGQGQDGHQGEKDAHHIAAYTPTLQISTWAER